MQRRLFVAVPVKGGVAQRISAAIAALDHLAPRARPVAGDQLHLTLRFLGATDEALLAPLEAALREALAGAPAFELAVAGARVFGSPRRARVLYADLAGDLAPLAELALRVDRAAEGLGLPPRDRPFAPHLTLARARDRGGDPALGSAALALADESFGPLPVFEVVLYESELSSRGARHLVRAQIPLLPLQGSPLPP